MAQARFRIEELSRSDASNGELFEWSANNAPAIVGKGGRRAGWTQPWTMGGELRNVRTDYPGAVDARWQVLGRKKTDQTLEGEWDDRYNFEGFAVGEMRRFEAMCERGNLVEISLDAQSFRGLIVEYSFTYEHAAKIGYSFTFSPSRRTDDAFETPTPKHSNNASDVHDKIEGEAALIKEISKGLPTNALAGTWAADLVDRLQGMSDAMDSLSDKIDGRDSIPTLKPIQQLKQLSTAARIFQGSVSNVLVHTASARSDVEVGVRTAMSVLDFESTLRDIRFHAYLAMGSSMTAARDFDERAEPVPLRVYRPHKNESLYQVSARFYGTPHAWRLIADRNDLRTMNLTGTEFLVIPERGEG